MLHLIGLKVDSERFNRWIDERRNAVVTVDEAQAQMEYGFWDLHAGYFQYK